MGKETRNPLVKVYYGGRRLFDFDAQGLIVHIKPPGQDRIIEIDLKRYLSAKPSESG